MTQISWILLFIKRIILMLPFNPRDALRRIVVSDGETILDVSCGHGRNGIVVKCHNRSVRLIGFDIFRPYVIESKHLNVYDDLLVADVRCPPFQSKSVSVVYFTEAIEHLRKEEGKEALRVLETIATKKIISNNTNRLCPKTSP